MTDISIPMDAFEDTCQRDDCQQPTPWDMPAIAINQDRVYCSPECAIQDLSVTTFESVTLHDPQYSADRPATVADDVVDVGRPVSGVVDAARAIGEVAEWMPAEFRVEARQE